MRRRHASVKAISQIALGVVVAAGVVSSATPVQAAPGCAVDYVIRDQWSTGFTADVTIRNTGDPITGWQLGWTFTAGQQVVNGWNGEFGGTPPAVTVRDVGWNANLATGASTTFGFNGSHTGTNPNPASFTLNGTVCGGGPVAAPTAALTSPPAGARFAAPATVPLAATATAGTGATISRVEFRQGTTLIGADTSSPYTFIWADVPAGNYTVFARAVDSLGQSGDSLGVPIVVETGPPPGSIVASPPQVFVQPGQDAPVTLTLSSQPSGTVTVTVARTSGSTALSVASGSPATFTPTDWDQPHTVRIAAASGTANGTAATFTASASGVTSVTIGASVNARSPYTQRFLDMYTKLKDPASGYFSRHGIPYHSVETLIVEAPDYGHQTTSEAFSFWLWLEANFGQVTGQWQPFNQAWATTEQFIIPSAAQQPTTSFYNPSSPATYAAEFDQPSQYPTPLDSSVQAGQDPLAAELRQTYGNSDVYGMHWLLDVDNRYGYGNCGDGTSSPVYINSYQRGPQESVWETVPHPECETFTFGGPNGYLPLFVNDPNPARQWRYTNAPDADARAIQAAYWALTWASEQGNQAQISATVAKAAKMGDFLRYSMFDKYFKQIGNCVDPQACPAGTGRQSAHFLLSWYYAWGGAQDTSAGWAWRIGSSPSHFGYQNPLAAWALSNVAALQPRSPSATADWEQSLARQLEFYRWLQSSEGAIAGGATNSWAGRYAAPPAGTSTFYGMPFDVAPVFHDPPSNRWFGFQAWSMERVAEYYFVTKDPVARPLLDKWVQWASANTTVSATGWQIPNDLEWTGQPATWNPTSPAPNTNLHVQVLNHTNDVGITAALARTLMYYASATANAPAQNLAKSLLDVMWSTSQDSRGVSVPETKADYNRFDDPFNATTQQGLFVPEGFTGSMPNGDPINSDSTFLSIRSWYTQDPQWPKVQSYLDGGAAPTFTYHRFWAQSDVAMAMADYGRLFG